jgi:hypothetical protein
MANSNLLKEAIADAKAVRETAIANAKIALEEAFTPRLQSILSQKLTQEIEEADEEKEEVEENEVVEATDTVEEEVESSDIGKSDNAKPSKDASDSSDISEG